MAGPFSVGPPPDQGFGPVLQVPHIVFAKMLEMLGGTVVFDGYDIKLADEQGTLRLEALPHIEFIRKSDPFQIIVRIAE